MLTYQEHFHNILSQDDLKRGGIIMTGVILCSKCRRKMDGVCQCGNYKCLIRINYKGKYYEYRRDNEGDVLTYQKAQNKLIEINQAIREKHFNPVDFTDAKINERKFENQIELWLKEKINREAQGELSPGTLKDYKGYVVNYFKFYNSIDVRDIRLHELTAFKDTLTSVSIKTRKNIINALRNFFNWLYERGTIEKIPSFPKVKGNDSHERKAIDVETQDIALKNIPEIHRDIIEFLMETGLRPGEACALLAGHIDIRHGTARIERTFSGNILRQTTKQHRTRTIPLSERALQIVIKHTENKLPNQYLFVNPTTRKNYLPDTLWRIWRYNAGIEGITLYEGTRHSFGSQLVLKNDVTIVKELMGHSTIKTTSNYLHFRMNHLSGAINSRRDNIADFVLKKEQKKTG